MGAKLTVALLLALLLTGCASRVENRPYYLSDDGVKVYSSESADPYKKQVLEFCHGPDYALYHTRLNSYDGSLYALSNYREMLLENGYVEQSCTRTSSLIDCVLYNHQGRVRLIYQSTGAIRIVFENKDCAAHILLKEIER